MSKERARAREARLAERRRELERRAKARARHERLQSLKPQLPSVPRRRRRYGALPLKLQLGLAFGWLATQWVIWQLVPDVRSRIALAVVALLALPVVAVLVRTPPRGS